MCFHIVQPFRLHDIPSRFGWVKSFGGDTLALRVPQSRGFSAYRSGAERVENTAKMSEFAIVFGLLPI